MAGGLAPVSRYRSRWQSIAVVPDVFKLKLAHVCRLFAFPNALCNPLCFTSATYHPHLSRMFWTYSPASDFLLRDLLLHLIHISPSSITYQIIRA